METRYNEHLEMLKAATAAFEKLPENFELLGVHDTGCDDARHIALHVTAHMPNERFPEFMDIDSSALRRYAEMAGLKTWFEESAETGKIVFDYFHALDENGTEIYQGIERGRDQDDA